MARRGRDLFELLRERSGGAGRSSASSGRATSRAAAPRVPASGAGPGSSFLARLSGSVRALVAGGKPAAAPRRTAAPRVATAPAVAAGLPAGATVVGLILIALLLGFVLGRFTAPKGDPSAGNRPTVAPARIPDYQGVPGPGAGTPKESPRVPDPVASGARGAPQLSAEQEEENLSTLGFYLLQSPARDRARAAECAAWFRDHGLARTRLRPVKTKNGEPWFLVICYTTAQDQDRDRQTIRALDLPMQFDDPSGRKGLLSVGTAVGMMQAPHDLSTELAKPNN